MNDEFEIRLLDWEQARAGAALVRRRVFIEEQGVPENLEWDELDALSLHALCLDASMPIATARLIHHPEGREVVVGRMAVLMSYRNMGLGSRILLALLDQAEATGCSRVELNAQAPALPFYRRFGFRATGPVFEEAGIDHRRMTLLLSRRKR